LRTERNSHVKTDTKVIAENEEFAAHEAELASIDKRMPTLTTAFRHHRRHPKQYDQSSKTKPCEHIEA
jgi:hypothetical protein